MIFEKITVNDVHAIKTLNKRIPAGTIGAQVQFEFGPMWGDLTKTAVFRGCCTKDVLNIGDTVTIPAEVIAKPCNLQIGIYGVDGNGNATPTFWTSRILVGDATNPSGDTSTDPSLPVWAQLQTDVEQLKQQGGGTVDEATVQKIVEDYLAENPPTTDEDGEDGITPLTYEELKGLRDNAQLVAGMFYRITDYLTTTTQEYTQSAGHPFDIIVRALTENTLDEDAKAIQHDGDEYFSNSALSGWNLRYSLDNDTSRFAWADEVNGKGVIYRLIDENGNECPYDFKNIQMRNPLDAADENYYYTFDSNGADHSLSVNLCFNNTITKYIVTAQEINNIIFIANGYEVNSNYFDAQCYNNVFYLAQRNNRFGRECYGNLFRGHNQLNTFDTKFRNNTVGSEAQSMTFGQGATSNVIGANTYYTRFGNYFRYNTTCSYLYYSEFGHYVSYCNLGESADAPDQCMRYLTFENNVQYVNLYKTDKTTKTYMENVRLCSGLVGKSASPIMIEVSELGQEYAITYANNSSGELVKYCDADGGNIDTDAIVKDVIAALPVYGGEVEDA